MLFPPVFRRHHFYPRPPRGGRLSQLPATKPAFVFLSTPSARRATTFSSHPLLHIRISIHALREEGDGLPAVSAHEGQVISIHALREEGDFATHSTNSRISYFYPRPPRGGRLHPRLHTPSAYQFLSTPSARRATPEKYPNIKPNKFLSTPSARRATYVQVLILHILRFLSTPSARRATKSVRKCSCHQGFLSTPSARRAT